MYTIDASVWVSAYMSIEPSHAPSLQFLVQLQTRGFKVHLPTIVIPEVVASIWRRTGSSDATLVFSRALRRIPLITWHSLDLPAAEAAASVASTCRLRGADAIYVTVAQATGSTLVSLDSEQLTRSSSVVAVTTPAQIVASL
jgi:predicted nucleic acid-binding protein